MELVSLAIDYENMVQLDLILYFLIYSLAVIHSLATEVLIIIVRRSIDVSARQESRLHGDPSFVSNYF